MTTITIHADGSISGAGLPLYGPVRYRVDQQGNGTVVTRILSATTEPVTMPCGRYALSTEAPASGIPGRADFVRDFLAAIRS